jgi:hypothetical protein
VSWFCEKAWCSGLNAAPNLYLKGVVKGTWWIENFEEIKKTRREQVALPPAVLLAGLSNYFFFVAALVFGLADAAFFFGAAFFFVTAKSLTSFHREGNSWIILLSYDLG